MVMKLIRKRGVTSARRVPKLFSSVLFWFVLTLISFALVAGSEYLGICLVDRARWDGFFGLSTPFLTGGLVSFFFYFLVVWVPERRKRKAIKNDFRKFYRDLKEDIAVQIIFVSQKGGRKDLRVDGHTQERLLTVYGFREAFGGGRKADEGFYAFSNGLDEGGREFQEIQWLLRMLAKEIDYVLHKLHDRRRNNAQVFQAVGSAPPRARRVGSCRLRRQTRCCAGSYTKSLRGSPTLPATAATT